MKKLTFIEEAIAKFLNNVLGIEGALHLLVCLWRTTYGLIYGLQGGVICAGIALVLSVGKELIADKKFDFTDIFWGIWGIMIAFALYIPKDWILSL